MGEIYSTHPCIEEWGARSKVCRKVVRGEKLTTLHYLTAIPSASVRWEESFLPVLLRAGAVPSTVHFLMVTSLINAEGGVCLPKRRLGLTREPTRIDHYFGLLGNGWVQTLAEMTVACSFAALSQSRRYCMPFVASITVKIIVYKQLRNYLFKIK